LDDNFEEKESLGLKVESKRELGDERRNDRVEKIEERLGAQERGGGGKKSKKTTAKKRKSSILK
jgi:hypothetical protein